LDIAFYLVCIFSPGRPPINTIGGLLLQCLRIPIDVAQDSEMISPTIPI
jgi:hypothetical protein